MRILAIDDNIRFRMRFQRIFEQAGHPANILADPDRLVDYLTDADQTYDVLVLDLHIPRVNGFESLARAREAYPPGRAFPKVIVVTGDEDPNAAAQASAEGVRFFLGKANLDQALPRALAVIEKELASS